MDENQCRARLGEYFSKVNVCFFDLRKRHGVVRDNIDKLMVAEGPKGNAILYSDRLGFTTKLNNEVKSRFAVRAGAMEDAKEALIQLAATGKVDWNKRLAP